MIIGSGMIASAFESYRHCDSILIFASGVSNSQNTNKQEFLREKKLLLKTINENIDKTIVYFSTCSIDALKSNSQAYIVHKLEMERIVSENCKFFYIFRLPQVAGKTNSPTFARFMFNVIQKNIYFKLNQYSSRNLILVRDVYEISKYIIDNKHYINEVTNIAAAKNYLVHEIVSRIEIILNRKANYSFVNCGSIHDINISKLIKLNNNFDIFDENYLDKLLNVYYCEYHKQNLNYGDLSV